MTSPEPEFGPLIAEIERLPERFRAPVVLHYFEGLSTEATAQRLGCARGTVLSRLARARERLRRRLERRGGSFESLMPAVSAWGRSFPNATLPLSLVKKRFAPPDAWPWPERQSKALHVRRSWPSRAAWSAV